MMTNTPYGTHYVGVSSPFEARLIQHRDGLRDGFTTRYRLTGMAWYVTHEVMTLTIRRERTLKAWPRQWKINLLEHDNPRWDDLCDSVMNWTAVTRQF